MKGAIYVYFLPFHAERVLQKKIGIAALGVRGKRWLTHNNRDPHLK